MTFFIFSVLLAWKWRLGFLMNWLSLNWRILFRESFLHRIDWAVLSVCFSLEIIDPGKICFVQHSILIATYLVILFINLRICIANTRCLVDDRILILQWVFCHAHPWTRWLSGKLWLTSSAVRFCFTLLCLFFSRLLINSTWSCWFRSTLWNLFWHLLIRLRALQRMSTVHIVISFDILIWVHHWGLQWWSIPFLVFITDLGNFVLLKQENLLLSVD